MRALHNKEPWEPADKLSHFPNQSVRAARASVGLLPGSIFMCSGVVAFLFSVKKMLKAAFNSPNLFEQLGLSEYSVKLDLPSQIALSLALLFPPHGWISFSRLSFQQPPRCWCQKLLPLQLACLQSAFSLAQMCRF